MTLSLHFPALVFLKINLLHTAPPYLVSRRPSLYKCVMFVFALIAQSFPSFIFCSSHLCFLGLLFDLFFPFGVEPRPLEALEGSPQL